MEQAWSLRLHLQTPCRDLTTIELDFITKRVIPSRNKTLNFISRLLQPDRERERKSKRERSIRLHLYTSPANIFLPIKFYRSSFIAGIVDESKFLSHSYLILQSFNNCKILSEEDKRKKKVRNSRERRYMRDNTHPSSS